MKQKLRSKISVQASPTSQSDHEKPILAQWSKKSAVNFRFSFFHCFFNQTLKQNIKVDNNLLT